MQGPRRGGNATLWRRQVTSAAPPRAFGTRLLPRTLTLTLTPPLTLTLTVTLTLTLTLTPP